MKNYNDTEQKDLNVAGDAMEYIRSLKQQVLAGKEVKGDEEPAEEGEIEEMLRKLRPIIEMNREKETMKLQARLESMKRRRIIRRRWYAVSTVAAVLTLIVGTTLLMHTPELPESKQESVQLTEIKVPTLITIRENDILNVETLDLQKQEPVYITDLLSGNKEGEDIQPPVYYKHVVIPAGYTYAVMLADGSKVTLNAGSELKFPVEFRDSIRQVELSGEGYFEVAKSQLPFVVQAGEAKVRVYGTRFNLFYSQELAIAEAVLVEGSIGMTLDSAEIKMLPSQRLVYDLTTHLNEMEEVDPDLYTGWMENSFKYHSARLDRIVFDMSKWYGINIQLDADMQAETFSVEFDKSVSVEWALGVLEKITGKNIKKEGGDYYLK